MEKIYDLTDNHYFQNNEIEKFEYIKIERENKSNSSEDAIYSFDIQGQDNTILYSDGYLLMALKIVKNNGDSIQNENVGLVNGGGLIKGKKLIIGSQTIESISEYCFILDQILRHIHFTKDYASSEAENMYFYSDTADSTDTNIFKYDETLTDQTKMTDFFKNLKLNENYNEGFAKRCYFTKNSQTVTISIPLKYIFDIFSDYRKVFSGFHVRMEFQRNTSKNMLVTDESNPYFKVLVEDMNLFLPQIKFKNEADVRFKQLKVFDSWIEINWNQYRISKSNTQHKVNSGSWSIPAESDEVLAVYVIPHYIDRNDNYNKNNLIFDNLDMIECWVIRNGQEYPISHYKMDFPKKEYNQLYTALLKEGLNTMNAETGCMISYKQFGELYPIICFDLSNHENFTSLVKRNIEFNWRLRNNTTKDYEFYFILKERKKCFINMAKNEMAFSRKD